MHDPRLAAAILDNARAYAIFTLDLEGRITSWSAGAEAVLGYPAEAVMGHSFSLLFTDSDIAAGVAQAELDKVAEAGRAEDSRWHVRAGGVRFWANGVAMRLEGDGLPGIVKVLRDETPLKLAQDQRVLLLNELNHRIKNTLATVQAIAEQTLRAAETPAATRADLAARLMALSRAHDVLLQENWAGADLAALVDQALAPYRQTGRPLPADGPDIRLSPNQAVALSLTLHELATNAVKYGALSVPDGGIRVSWNLSNDAAGGRHMTLLWAESDGPSVTPPTRSGFGSRLIERTFGNGSGG